MAAVSEETGRIALDQRRPAKDVAKGYVRFMEGDVIFAKITPCMENGKVAPVSGLPSQFGAGSTEFHVLRPKSIDQRYLWYWLVSRRFRQQAQRHMSGSAGQLRVPVDYLRRSLMPVPPLLEQRHIVTRIDELFAEIEEGEAALADARKGLEKFRRALLKGAVTGALTEDWRAANPVGETGHDLLARIKSDRAAHDPANRRGRRAAEARPLDAPALPAIPKGWVWANVDQAKSGDQRNGISIPGSPTPPGTKALRLDALTVHGLDLKAVRYIPLPDERIADYRVNNSDLLISRANGSAEFVGRAVYVSQIGETVVFPDTIIRYPLGPDRQFGRWLEMAWNSALGRSQIHRLAKTTAGILKISQQDISQVALPIPPPSEVAEILRRISDALSTHEDTLTILDAEAADAMRLKQSILKAAFQGRLVPQDPNDEPAVAMLARLKSTHSIAEPARRRRRSKS
ncbi:restriction endonuclease subunit S [Mesorhizobium sp. M1216]|uniref:restriction endonuclease subunit S n=1 Tax=Mesorhizobium sp. M1216 TaxID=2957069 RepID=UPI0033364307